MKIMMVCLGNICRSPLAEGILKHKAKMHQLPWEISSAGTNHYHTGEPPHALSQKVARINGIDICDQRARRFRAQDFREYDVLYAMAADVVEEMRRMAGKEFNPEKVRLLMDVIYPGEQMDVPDPWYGTEPGYHEVYSMIDMACDKIIQDALATDA